MNMNPEARLALLFQVWADRVKTEGYGAAVDDRDYPEACAAYLIKLDAETDGEKLWPDSQTRELNP